MMREWMALPCRSLVAILCSIVLAPGDTLVYAQEQAAASTPKPAATPLTADQLDSLVAPIALYPDPLLAQVLAASTYPLEIVKLQRWLAKNSTLKDKALADAVLKEPWDPSVQALAGLPEVVKRLGDDIGWTADLGNAFLAQQNDVMDAVQRMRKKAQDKGTLKSTEQQKVETKVVETKQVIVIEQANPQVVYVPSYDPVVVWGAAIYPYPPIYYPPYGYYAAGAALAFGAGVMMGAFWGGGWGWGCGWGGNTVNINNNFNNFNRNTNINGGNRNNINGGGRNQAGNGGRNQAGDGGRNQAGDGGRNQAGDGGRNQAGGGSRNWQHNPEHRGGTPYRDRATADKFGGSARGDSMAQRRSGAESRVGGGSSGLGNRTAGSNLGNRTSGSGLSGSGAGNRGGAGGADRIGSRDLSRSGGGDRGAFGGGSRGYSGSSARSSSSRGSSSVSRGGGGMSRGGGGGRRR